MRKAVLFIIAVIATAGCFTSRAQGRFGADSAECIKYLSYYQEYYKQKSYDDALPSWRKAFALCPPSASKNMLSHGTVLIGRVISKNSSNAEYKAALVDTLMRLYDLSIENNPKKSVEILNNKGIDIHKFVTDPQVLYTEYEKIIAGNQEKTKPTFYAYDFSAAVDCYNNGTIGAEDVINAYERNIDLVSNYPCKNGIDSTQVEKIKKDLGGLFISSNVASCDNLIALYTPRLEAEPENPELVNAIVKTMGRVDNCQSNELFLQAVTTMNRLNPSAITAYYLYKLHAAQGDASEAIKYMNAAIESDETSESQRNDYLFEAASYCYSEGRNSEAYNYASRLTDTKYAGKAYFMMGSIWAATNCGGNEVTALAHFWVAVDYMQKAKSVDPELAEDANRSIGTFSAHFPAASDAFMYDITNGQSYTVVCGGMRATTTVRTIKK